MCLTSWSGTAKWSDTPIVGGKIKWGNQKNIMGCIKGARRSSLLAWKELRSPYQSGKMKTYNLIFLFTNVHQIMMQQLPPWHLWT